MSAYLAGGDLATYGVPNATVSQIMQASGVIDGYLARPEGLAFSPDYQGQPCYMTAASPVLTFTLAGSISPGSNIVATLTGGIVNTDLLGEVLIIERATPAHTEALVISAVGPAPGQVTFQTVGLAHSSGTFLETGMVVTEERSLPSKRSVARVAKFPLVRVISGVGRYGYGRRSDQVAGLFNDANLLATLETFGGPPQWFAFDVTQVSVSAATGEVWIPAGMLLAYYSEVRLKYVAGWPTLNVPTPVKVATAMLISAAVNYPELAANVKKIGAGGTSIERFTATALDADTRAALSPFRAQLFY